MSISTFRQLVEASEKLQRTPIIDDDFHEARHKWDSALIAARKDLDNTITLEVSSGITITSPREVLSQHGRRAIARCIEELTYYANNPDDHAFDEMGVQALQTAIESMQMRLASAAPESGS